MLWNTLTVGTSWSSIPSHGFSCLLFLLLWWLWRIIWNLIWRLFWLYSFSSGLLWLSGIFGVFIQSVGLHFSILHRMKKMWYTYTVDFFFFWDRISCSLGWPRTHYAVRMTLNSDQLLPCARCTGTRHHTWIMQLWWLHAELLSILVKDSTYWAIHLTAQSGFM